MPRGPSAITDHVFHEDLDVLGRRSREAVLFRGFGHRQWRAGRFHDLKRFGSHDDNNNMEALQNSVQLSSAPQ